MTISRIWHAFEKSTKLLRPVAAVKLADHATGFQFQSRKQRGSAVAIVIVRPPFQLARSYRQQLLRAVQVHAPPDGSPGPRRIPTQCVPVWPTGDVSGRRTHSWSFVRSSSFSTIGLVGRPMLVGFPA